DAGREVTGRRPLVVTSPATAAVRHALGETVDYALQAEPRGTGDAVAAALAALPDSVDEILVLTGDAPLLEASLLDELLVEGRLTGINDRAELAQAEWDLRTRINSAHMRAGVTMRDPSTVYLDASVTIAEDVVLEPNVILRGTTTVGQGTTIGAGSQIFDSTI